ncbi:hypothetical protein ACCC96_03215 [Pseudomonas sp. Pseusp11]|uniref:hypothetical protein n=1 Tax=Pseudomonas sp. Pseusp11 TaxID=3243003 RepID=UPI0039B62DB0
MFIKPLYGCAISLLFLLYSVSSAAVSIEVTAEFKPDSANPARNEFTNTTPFTGHCASYPTFCSDLSIFSILVPIKFNSISAIDARHTDVRKGAMFRAPTDWRPLQVVNKDTREESTLYVRIASIGARYYLPGTVQSLIGEGAPTSDIEAHEKLWGGYNWTYPSPPCFYTGGMFVQPTWRSFFWLTAAGGGMCAPTADYQISSLYYDRFQIGYALRTPNPLGMSAGQYVGSYTYSVGPGLDFDMGDIMLPEDNSLTINFTLDVQHTLRVDIPPGGNKVELVPQGGWQGWLQQGRKPTRLFRDQAFNISASSRFKMNLECEYSQDSKTCAVRDSVSGHAVPMNISVSLPQGLTDGDGAPVNRRQLQRDGSGTQLFQPGFYVDRKPGTLHFEIPASEVAEMIRPERQRHYSGSVTVIWDSDV